MRSKRQSKAKVRGCRCLALHGDFPYMACIYRCGAVLENATGKAQKPVNVQTLHPQAAIENFDERIVRQFACAFSSD